MASAMASLVGLGGRLADEQALHLGGQHDGDDAEQQADERSSRRRPRRALPVTIDRPTRDEGDDQADQRAGVLEQHDGSSGAFDRRMNCEPAGARPRAGWTRAPRCGTRSPRARWRPAGCRWPTPGDSSSWGCSSFSTPSKMANIEPSANSTIDDHERPEVALAAVAERVARRSAPRWARVPPSSSRTWLPVSASECTPSASIDDDRVNDEADELGDGDAEVGQQGGEHRLLAAAGRHGGVLAQPARAATGSGRCVAAHPGGGRRPTRPMASDAVAAGDGRVDHVARMRASVAAAKAKSSSRVPSRATAWARTPLPAGTRSSSLQLGHEPLERARPRAPAQRAGDLAEHRCASSGGPGATWRRSVAMAATSRRVDVAPAVALAGQGQHRVGAGVHRAVDPRVRCTPRNGKRGSGTG